jgi:hypothetical protein
LQVPFPVSRVRFSLAEAVFRRLFSFHVRVDLATPKFTEREESRQKNGGKKMCGPIFLPPFFAYFGFGLGSKPNSFFLNL